MLDETELELLARHASDGSPRRRYDARLYRAANLARRLGCAGGTLISWRAISTLAGSSPLGRDDRPARRVELLKTEASERYVPIFPAVERELARLRDAEEQAGRGRDDDLVFCTSDRTAALAAERRAVDHEAATAAGLGKLGPHDLRRSFCSLAGRRGVDPVEAAQITGHSPEVWARHYARSFGKAQREEARRRMLAHGFGASKSKPVPTAVPTDPPRTHSHRLASSTSGNRVTKPFRCASPYALALRIGFASRRSPVRSRYAPPRKAPQKRGFCIQGGQRKRVEAAYEAALRPAKREQRRPACPVRAGQTARPGSSGRNDRCHAPARRFTQLG